MGVMRNRRAELGSLGTNVVDILTEAIEGGQNDPDFDDLTADTIVADTSVIAPTIGTSLSSTPRAAFVDVPGILSTITMTGDGQNSLSIFGAADSVKISASNETGQFDFDLTDNLADALSIKIASGNDFITFCSTNNSAGAAGEYVALGGTATGVIWQRVESIPDATTSEAVGVYDSGKVYVQLDADEAVTFQLPATQNGLIYTFVCGNAGGEINISPNAADKITGKGIAGADNQDIKNTNASNAVGDCITLIGDGADGWLIINMLGTWATV